MHSLWVYDSTNELHIRLILTIQSSEKQLDCVDYETVSDRREARICTLEEDRSSARALYLTRRSSTAPAVFCVVCQLIPTTEGTSPERITCLSGKFSFSAELGGLTPMAPSLVVSLASPCELDSSSVLIDR